MKTYVVTGQSHMCFDDEEKTIISITNSSNSDNSSIAYTKDPLLFKALYEHAMTEISGSDRQIGARPAFEPDTEEIYNSVRELVLNKLNALV
jgi:hypothetical protein